MSREAIIADLNREYAAKRREDQAAFEEKRQHLCACCPGLSELLDARHAMVMTGVRTALLQGQRNSTDYAAIMRDYNQKIRALLKENGYLEDALTPVYHCPLCKDEGYVNDPSRRMCDCMQKELAARWMKENGLMEDGCTFQNFNEGLFAETEEETRPRLIAKANFSIGQRYAREYPDCKTPNMLIMGKSGLGKTYLLRAIAHTLTERGFMPLYMTAYRLFELERTAHMENRPELMQEPLSAPILMIDDLGTEPMMNNVTVVQLFNLLNVRQMEGRHTLISTNLTLTELQARYTERITSRLMDENAWTRLIFKGSDIRLRLREVQDQQ